MTDTTRIRLTAVVETVPEGERRPIRAMLPMPLDEQVSITVAVTPNGGRADGYELSANTTLTIAAGATDSTGEVIFTSLDDFEYTGTRYFNATLTPDHLRVDADTESFTVVDDDNTITGWRVSPSTIFENGGEATLRANKHRLHEGVVKMSVSLDPSDRATLSGTTLTFQPGAIYATETLTITAVDNAADELDQTITISAMVTEGRGVRTPPPLELTIVDDDNMMSPDVALVLTPSRVREGLVSMVTAVASGPLDDDATITVSASPGHADTRPDDFVLSANTVLTIPAGGTRSMGAVTIATVDDTLSAGRRRREVTVSARVTGGGGVADPADQTLTILEDDPRVQAALIATPATISEGEVSTITLRALQPVPADVTVTVEQYTDLDAAVLSASPVLTIAEGQTESTGVVTLTALQDADMNREVVGLRGTPSDDSQFVLVRYGVNVFILDDDIEQELVTVSPVPAQVFEGGASTVIAKLGQRLSNEVTITVGVDESDPNHTATADDFTLSANRMLTISAGSLSSTGAVTLTASDDEYYGPFSSRKVALDFSATGIDQNRVREHSNWTIIEDEDQPKVTLAVTPGSIAEGNGQSTVTASLNTIVESDVEVTVTTAPAGAAEPDDITQTGTLLTIPEGQKNSMGTVTISSVDDDVYGPDKHFVVTGTAEVVGMEQSGLVWFPSAEGLTITDDDTAPTAINLSLNPDSVSEDAAATNITVTASLNGSALPAATTVTVTRTGGTATSGTDYPTITPFFVTIAARATSGTATLSFDPTDDDISEGSETVILTATATGLNAGTATLTITDDDTAPTAVTLSLNPDAVSEGDSATDITVTASLNGSALPAATTVTVTRTGGTATSGTDYPTITAFSVTIDARATSGTATLSFDPTDDDISEGSETVILTATATGLNAGTATLTITDDDTAPTAINLSLNPDAVSEGDSATDITVTASLNGSALPAATTVTVTRTGGTATSGTDYPTITAFSVTIDARATSGTATLSFDPTDDDISEGSETVILTATATGLTAGTATLTITDDDTAPTAITLSLNPDAVSEGDSATDITVTASLNGSALPAATTVTVTRTGGTATSGTDYPTITAFSVTIDARATSGTATLSFDPTDDDISEGSETVILTATATGLNAGTATLTITDDDTAPTAITLSLNPDAVSEDAAATNVTVTASLNGSALPAATTVRVTRTGGTATSGTDYPTITAFSVTIAARATSGTATLSFDPTDDDISEGSETVILTATATGLTAGTATLTITDDDTAPTAITLSLNPDAVSEDAAATNITVTTSLNGSALPTATTVTVTRTGGTATSGTDYPTITPFSVTIDARATSGTATLSFDPTEDDISEGSETVILTATAISKSLFHQLSEAYRRTDQSPTIQLLKHHFGIREQPKSKPKARWNCHLPL